MPPSISLQHGGPNPEGGSRRSSRILTLILSIAYILYSLEVGIFLLCLPWFGFWDNNYLLYLYPQIRPVVANSFFKGAVMGLGVANIIIGIHEILHFKKSRNTALPRLAGSFRG